MDPRGGEASARNVLTKRKQQSPKQVGGVSNSMKERGYDFSGEQCRLKIKSMKEKYDRNKKKSLKSGESPPDSDCEELNSVFDRCPDMKPVFVIDTSTDKAKPMTSSLISDSCEEEESGM